MSAYDIGHIDIRIEWTIHSIASGKLVGSDHTTHQAPTSSASFDSEEQGFRLIFERRDDPFENESQHSSVKIEPAVAAGTTIGSYLAPLAIIEFDGSDASSHEASFDIDGKRVHVKFNSR